MLHPAKQLPGIKPWSDVLELANFVKTISHGSYFTLASGAPRQAYTSNYFTRNQSINLINKRRTNRSLTLICMKKHF